jgi:hypothetical protein
VPERAQQHHGAEQRAPDHRPHTFAMVRVAREDDDVYVCGVVTAGDPLGFIAGFWALR